jgi:DNA polymerase III gamma/tau subunit
VLDYETYINVTDLILENKIPDLLMSFNEILSKGFDAHHFVSGLASHFRDLLVSKNTCNFIFIRSRRSTKNVWPTSTNAVKTFFKRN